MRSSKLNNVPNANQKLTMVEFALETRGNQGCFQYCDEVGDDDGVLIQRKRQRRYFSKLEIKEEGWEEKEMKRRTKREQKRKGHNLEGEYIRISRPSNVLIPPKPVESNSGKETRTRRKRRRVLQQKNIRKPRRACSKEDTSH